jgi:short-subunit dehydrogenase
VEGAGSTRIEAFKLDITDSSDRARAAEIPIDVLINNAAVGESGSLAEVPLERVRATFETNLFATLALTQAC